jgi:hydroxymethylpyrimidine pyrophosphatase-like HAD family hydrolase
MRIGIDIDDTITNSYNKILEELQKEYEHLKELNK